jgi:carbon-monoxide dehydrogenase medium subunit/2-furoyl-CoA dehydrogenase FAD binding subunit
LDFAWGTIAASVNISEGKCTQANLVLGSLASAPIILKKTAEVAVEGELTEHAIEKAAETARSELGTLTNLFTSAGYKRHIAQVLVRRALNELRGTMKSRRRTKS